MNEFSGMRIVSLQFRHSPDNKQASGKLAFPQFQDGTSHIFGLLFPPRNYKIAAPVR